MVKLNYIKKMLFEYELKIREDFVNSYRSGATQKEKNNEEEISLPFNKLLKISH